MLEDIAILSGAEVITEEMASSSRTRRLAARHRPSRRRPYDTMTIIDGAGEGDAIKGRITDQVRDREHRPDSDREKPRSASRSCPAVSPSYVGAATETEMKETKHRVEDALQAAVLR
jgi:chaperonin GroEL